MKRKGDNMTIEEIKETNFGRKMMEEGFPLRFTKPLYIFLTLI